MGCVTEFDTNKTVMSNTAALLLTVIKITESQYTNYLKIAHVIARFLPRISDCDLLFWLLKGKFLKQLYNYTTAGFFSRLLLVSSLVLQHRNIVLEKLLKYLLIKFTL